MIFCMDSKETAVYIHIPFCSVKCTYCDFPSYAGFTDRIPAYMEALLKEIQNAACCAGAETKICSIYIGGGTPSLLSVEQIDRLLNTVRDNFAVSDDAEVTLEANPCTVDQLKAAGWGNAGINRVSIGMQSAISSELHLMGRRHTVEQVSDAAAKIRAAGIRNISLDLIYGFPTQTIESWSQSLHTALSFLPDHLSLYGLTVGDGIGLQRMLSAGRCALPSEECTADCYHLAESILEGAGFIHYEISNWAKEQTKESRHNRQYWLAGPYYGFGAGAHANSNHKRIENEQNIDAYINKIHGNLNNPFPAAVNVIPQTRRVEMQDFMMLGLRLLDEGVSKDRFYDRFGEDMESVFHREIHHLIQRGLAERTVDGRIRL